MTIAGMIVTWLTNDYYTKVEKKGSILTNLYTKDTIILFILYVYLNLKFDRVLKTVMSKHSKQYHHSSLPKQANSIARINSIYIIYCL